MGKLSCGIPREGRRTLRGVPQTRDLHSGGDRSSSDPPDPGEHQRPGDHAGLQQPRGCLPGLSWKGPPTGSALQNRAERSRSDLNISPPIEKTRGDGWEPVAADVYIKEKKVSLDFEKFIEQNCLMLIRIELNDLPGKLEKLVDKSYEFSKNLFFLSK